jgi:hypothetical protein
MATADLSERWRRWVWGLAATLLISLALTVMLLAHAQLDSLESELLPRESFGAILAAMVGMVILFVLYGTWQHGRIVSRERDLQRLAARESALRERLGELAAVLETSTRLAQQFDLHAALRLAAARVRPALEAGHSSVYLVSPRTKRLENVVSLGGILPDRARQLSAEGLVTLVYSGGEGVILDTEEGRQCLAREIGLEEIPRSALCVPIRFERTLLGVFCVARFGDVEPFVPMHAQALQALADQCGAAIVKRFHSHVQVATARAA